MPRDSRSPLGQSGATRPPRRRRALHFAHIRPIRVDMKIKKKPALSKRSPKSASGGSSPSASSASKAASSVELNGRDATSAVAAPRLGGIAKAKGKGKLAQSRKHALLPQLQDEVDRRVESAKQRKREKRRQAREAAGGGELKTASLDAMKASLEELLDANEEQHKQEWRTRKRSLTSKARSRIVVQETAHLQQVLEHPAFKADPIAALNEHIRNIVDASNVGSQASGQHPQHHSRSALAKKRGRD